MTNDRPYIDRKVQFERKITLYHQRRGPFLLRGAFATSRIELQWPGVVDVA